MHLAEKTFIRLEGKVAKENEVEAVEAYTYKPWSWSRQKELGSRIQRRHCAGAGGERFHPLRVDTIPQARIPQFGFYSKISGQPSECFLQKYDLWVHG